MNAPPFVCISGRVPPTVQGYELRCPCLEQTVRMPKAARLLNVQTHRGNPVLYALVDPAAPPVGRLIMAYHTGQAVELLGAQYVGTFQLLDATLEWHVFDLGERDRTQ